MSDEEKKVVWKISEMLSEELNYLGKTTFQEIRKIAYQLVNEGKYGLKYDSIIIDEVQDLDISSLKLLFSLCKNKNNLFLTPQTSYTQLTMSIHFSGDILYTALCTSTAECH